MLVTNDNFRMDVEDEIKMYEGIEQEEQLNDRDSKGRQSIGL